MKVKVKGLVFVGFAAAVFAQSAFATITPNTAEKKIVTSKYYVDSTFQEKEDKVKLTGTQTINDINSTQWESNDLYPSMKILKAKFDALTPAVGSNATDYVEFTESGDTLTVNFDNAPATAAADLTGYDASNAAVGAALTSPADKKLVTAGAINGMILRESTNGTTSIDQNATHATVPTSKNVYDFVMSQGGAAYQPKTAVGTGETNDTLKVGKGAGQWGNLEAITTNDQATGDYVTIKADINGVYQINLAAAQIADSIATDGSTKLATENAVYDYAEAQANKLTSTTPISSSSDDVKYPSAKNVYDFVNGNYQAKATTGSNIIEVGHDGAWANLVGDSTYTSVAMDGSNAKVSLANITTGSNSTEFVASGDTTNSGNRTKLARAGDVYDFVMAQTGGLAIPEMPDYCDTVVSQSGGYCALVYGAKDGGGTGLQWTIMAPDTMPTSQPEP